MKKILSILILICMGLSAYAINYPTYKPDPRDRQMQPNQPAMQRQSAPVVGGYSTVATGGTTTTGEGSAVAARANGPRRVHAGGTTPPDPSEDYEWVDDDYNYWVYNENAQQWEAGQLGTGEFWHPKDDDENRQPVGSPLVMLLFAAAACAAIRFRHRNAQA